MQTTITIQKFLTAYGAIERAGEYVVAMEAMVGYDIAEKVADGGTAVEPAFRLLSTAARHCLDQAREMHTEERVEKNLKHVHDSLVAVNVAYYAGMSHEDRCHLARERGFEFPEHTEWDEGRKVPALVFWLNDAYHDAIVEKVRIQARAYRRAGFPEKAAEVTVLAAVRKALREAGIDPEQASMLGDVARLLEDRRAA